MAKSATAKKPTSDKKPPVHKARCGHVTADVWANTNKDGVVSYSVTLQKSYKDDTDAWQNTDFLFMSDVQQARKALDMAHTWCIEQYAPEEA